MPCLIWFSNSSIVAGGVHSTNAFRYPIVSSHTELNLDGLVASESNLLFLSNGLEAFDLCTAVQQQDNEEKHLSVEIACLPDSFEVVKALTIDLSFCYSVL